LWFKSGDRPDNLRGGTLDALVMDEADYCEEYLWTDVLQPMLGVRNGRALFVSSPRLEGSWFHRLWQAGQGADPEVASWQFPTWDSPYWTPEKVEAARRELPSISFRREYGAEFVSAAGAIVRREDLRYGEPAAPLPVAVGVDLAISEREGADYTAMAAFSRDSEGRIWVRDVYRARLSFRASQEAVQAFAARWSPRVIAIEATQYQAAAVQELLRTTSLPVRGVKPDRDKLTRFQPLAARYEQHLVWHAPGLPREFEQELLAFPVGTHDDMVDACAYAFAALPMMAAPPVALHIASL
jgi:predicted phage terminase large subunit-like protein